MAPRNLDQRSRRIAGTDFMLEGNSRSLEQGFGALQRALADRTSQPVKHVGIVGQHRFINVCGLLHGSQQEACMQAFPAQAQCVTHGIEGRFGTIDGNEYLYG